MSKINFTLKENKHLERYFRFASQNYNGELSTFDKEFTGVCTYDVDNELFSFLNNLINSNKTSY